MAQIQGNSVGKTLAFCLLAFTSANDSAYSGFVIIVIDDDDEEGGSKKRGRRMQTSKASLLM